MDSVEPSRQCALIVEDDDDQRSLTAMLLQESGFETVECESAEAALATMLLRGREVCMVFADVRLSGAMDGIDLARELRVRWPSLTVVVTSGNSQVHGWRICRRASSICQSLGSRSAC